MSGKKKAAKGQSDEVESYPKYSPLSIFGPGGKWLTVCLVSGGITIGAILVKSTNYLEPVEAVVEQTIIIPQPNIEVPEIVLETITPADVEVIKESAPDINIPAEPDGGSYAEEPKDYDCGYFVGVWTDEIGRDAANKNCDVTVVDYMGDSVYFWNVKTRYMSDVTNFYYL